MSERSNLGPYLPGIRDPDEETEDYPNLIVHDGRVSGSITLNKSRLPVWAFSGDWSYAETGWDDLYGWDRGKWMGFLHDLLQHRGDFARLICVLADVQRLCRDRTSEVADIHFETTHPKTRSCEGCMPEEADLGWWQYADLLQRMTDALKNCLAALTLDDPTVQEAVPYGAEPGSYMELVDSEMLTTALKRCECATGPVWDLTCGPCLAREEIQRIRSS